MDEYIDLTDDTPHSNREEQGYSLRSTSVEEIDPSDWEASLEQQLLLEDSDGDCEILSDINPSVPDEKEDLLLQLSEPIREYLTTNASPLKRSQSIDSNDSDIQVMSVQTGG